MRRVGETLESLERVVVSRKSQPTLESYTSRLFTAGVAKIGEKVTEEAGELVAAAAAESAERVVSEAADLLYHTIVLLAFREVPLAQVEDELARRFGISGLEEKASREARTPGVPQANSGEST
ncbi:MAG: phosphoribosyl-ATP diphosphatase [Planctomycetota bacterium]